MPDYELATKLKSAFAGQGKTISAQKLKSTLSVLNPSFSTEELLALLQVADKNGDGVIDGSEFIDFVCFIDNDDCVSADNEEQELELQRKYDTPWLNSTAVVKDMVQMLYQVVALLDIDPSVENEKFTKMSLTRAVEPNGAVRRLRSTIETEIAFDKDDRKATLANNLFNRLESMEFKARVFEHAYFINLEELVDLVFPKLKEKPADKKMVHSWLQEFKFRDVVRRFFLKVTENEPFQLQPADIKFIFDRLDVNKDGSVSMQDFRKYGFLTKQEVEQLFSEFDFFTQQDRKVQIQEIMTLVFQHSQSNFASSLKAAFASSNQ
jgi:Ca2+-binding EF-hand superfamily protein